jgi:enoyl-[acyl-carrier protein] reductase I
MGDLAGKNGLIVGVANKRSLAWAIARAADEAGARLTLGYATERFESNARKLADTLATPPQLVACDVTDDAAIADLYRQVDETHGGLDFLVHAVAFASREAISAPFLETGRADFAQSLDISAYSLVALARGAAPLMERRGGGSVVTLTYLGSDRVFPHYNVMGVAKAALEATVRYLANDLGPRNIRVNAISAGPIKTLAASGIPEFSRILQHYRESAPLGRTVDADEVAAAAGFLLGPGGRGVTGEVLMVDGGYHATGM